MLVISSKWLPECKFSFQRARMMKLWNSQDWHLVLLVMHSWIQDWVNCVPEREWCVDVEIKKVCMGSRKKEKGCLGVFRVIVCARLLKRQKKCVNIIPYAWRCCCVCIVTACQSCSSARYLPKWCSHGKLESVWHPACLLSSLLHGAVCWPTCRSYVPTKTMLSCMPETKNHSWHAG